MDLITRCPQCNATFPVTPEELQLRKGYIRCISCAHIFDGYEAIVPSAPKPATGRARPAAPTKIEPIVPGPPPVRPRKHPDAQTRQHPETQDRQRRDSHAHNHDAPSHSVASAPVLPIPVRARPEFTVSRNAPPTNAAPAREPTEPRSTEPRSAERGPIERAPVAREPVVRLPMDSGAPDHGPNDHGSAERGPTAGVPVVRVRAERGPADRGPADRGPAERGPADREPSVHEPTVREPSLGVTSLRGSSSREPSLHDRTWNEPVSSEPVFRFRDRPPVQDDTPSHHLAADDASHTALVPTVRVGRSTRAESRPPESRLPESGPDIEPIYVEPRATARRPETIDNATFTDDVRGRFRGLGHLFWGGLVLIGLAMLCAQAVYVYRVQIATQLPTLRPVLEQACEALDCTVTYPRRIDEIAIVASSLRARPKTGNAAANEPETLVLQLTMRNNYERAQQWPTLVLELKDFSGTAVAKKNLAPREYLSSGEAALPFAASSEAVISLPITLDGIKINGYQLSKFFP